MAAAPLISTYWMLFNIDSYITNVTDGSEI